MSAKSPKRRVRRMAGWVQRAKLSTYWCSTRVLIFLALLFVLQLGAMGQSRTVLAIYSDERLYPANIAIDQALRGTLNRGTDSPPTYIDEFLDVSRFGSPAYDKLLSEFLRHKYASMHLDVIIAAGDPAFQFLHRHQADLFAGIPVVLCGVSREFFQTPLPPHYIGMPVVVEPLPTIELALRLQPHAPEVVIVTGASEFDLSWESYLRNDLAHLKTSVPIRYLSGLALDDLLRELSRLPPNTIVYSPGFFRDGGGKTYIPSEAMQRMANASPAPIYGSYGSMIGSGIVGGYIFTINDMAEQAAGLVQRILHGEKLSQSDAPASPPLHYEFDWNQLQRWHILEKNLPQGSIIRFRELSPWQRYKQYMIATICFVLAETLLVLGLFWQRAKRRKIQQSLVDRLTFEQLLSDLSAKFINLPANQIGVNVEQDLARIGEFLDVDQLALFEFSRNKAEITAIFSWTRAGIALAPAPVKPDELLWWRDCLLRGDMALVSDLTDLPKEALAEREYFQQMGILSAASIPVRLGGEITGAISLISATHRVRWAENTVNQVKILGEVFWNALQRQRSMQAMLASQDVLRESEERFRLVADTAPVLIWMSGPDKLCNFFNHGWLSFRGRAMEQELGEGWVSGVHPDDVEHCLSIYSASFDARDEFEVEYRLRRFDGEYRWVVDYGTPRFESDGAFRGYIGSCIDITDRKFSETSLRELSGRLIHAQEEERTRIARELHDDLSQRMALLNVGLEQLKQSMTHLSAASRGQLHNIAEISEEVSSIIHNLSHQLHPSKLDTLGLVTSVASLCREFSTQYHLQAAFSHHGFPRQIPKDATLCLFRIVQEALRNVVKHSGAVEAQVELSAHSDAIDLCVSDSGTGFSPESAQAYAGLGLVSMRERLRLIGGQLLVESEPSHGTRIRVHVPLTEGEQEITNQVKTSSTEDGPRQ